MTPGEWIALVGAIGTSVAWLTTLAVILYGRLRALETTVNNMAVSVGDLVEEKNTRIATCAHHAAELDNLKKRVDSLEQRSFHAG